MTEETMVAPSTELVHVGEGGRSAAALAAMPVMDFETALERREAIQQFISKIMIPGEDYGIIPGSKKPSLWKPGAEKLTAFFGLAPEFDVVQRIELWDAKEPLFHYEIKCRLTRAGQLCGGGLGSCNSRESKYRWRQADRLCPSCGKPTIIKSKFDDCGWLCFAKKGGCGEKFPVGDPSIEGQEIGRIPNPDIADTVNTVLKIAKKRSHVDAILNTTGASQFFTQDLEDMEDGTTERGQAWVPPQKKAQPVRPQPEVVEAPLWVEDFPVPPTGPEPEPTRESIMEGVRKQFTSGKTVNRITHFREAKKSFQNLLGKDEGELRYQDWLQAAGVANPEDFKTLPPAVECYLHMIQNILDIEAKHGV